MNQDLEQIKRSIAEFRESEGRSPRMLVVDDEKDCYLLFARYMDGCEIVWADSAEKGLATIEADDDYFDAVIIDEKLPGMPGHVLLGVIKSRWPGIVVAYSTAFEPFKVETLSTLKEASPIVLLPKPLQRDHLKTLLHWIRQWQG